MTRRRPSSTRRPSTNRIPKPRAAEPPHGLLHCHGCDLLRPHHARGLCEPCSRVPELWDRQHHGRVPGSVIRVCGFCGLRRLLRSDGRWCLACLDLFAVKPECRRRLSRKRRLIAYRRLAAAQLPLVLPCEERYFPRGDLVA